MDIKGKSCLYDLIFRYMRLNMPFAYSRSEMVGVERIPADGALIFAPNHTNGLMDALNVLDLNGRPTLFVAKAELFRNPVAARVLNFLKLIPIMRIRDGRHNLKKNDEVNAVAVDAMRSGLAFSIFPEGTDRGKHSLMSIKKGIFRIALEAVGAFGDSKPVYIVPIGIEYGDYVRYRGSRVIEVGEPINVTEFVRKHLESEPAELINLLRDDLVARMQELIHFVPDGEFYEAKLDWCYLNNAAERKRNGLDDSPLSVKKANQMIAVGLERLCADDKERFDALIEPMRKFATLRRKRGIADDTVYNRPTIDKILVKTLILLLLLPYFVVSALHSSLNTGVAAFINGLVGYPEFRNSIRFLINAVTMPVVSTVTAVLLFVYLPWYWAVAVFALLLPSTIVAHDYVKQFRILVSDCRFLCDKRLREEFTGNITEFYRIYLNCNERLY